MIPVSDIFSHIDVRGVSFENRIVMAPMVRFGFPCSDGIMGEDLVREYLDRADKGIGLLISQSLSVSPQIETMGRLGTSGGAGAWSKGHIGYLGRIAHACHDGGSRFFAQLGLPGFAYGESASRNVNELTMEELADIRDRFIRAANICREAGLDGVELHGAHTYFLNTMVSPRSNRRMDSYGGNFDNRLRLVGEIVEGIKKSAEEDFLVSYRMGWGEDADDDIHIAQALEAAGIDILHVSTGIPDNRDSGLPIGSEFNEVVHSGCRVKGCVDIPVIAVNGIRTLARGDRLIESGACDFVAYGRPFLACAAFVERGRIDKDYRPCFECRECRWSTDGRTCPAQILERSSEAESTRQTK